MKTKHDDGVGLHRRPTAVNHTQSFQSQIRHIVLYHTEFILNMELPVPDQLQVQLGKCKTIREVDHHKSRTKTPKVSLFMRRIYIECSVI